GRPPGPGLGEPHLLVVVDDVAEGPGTWAGVAGVTVLRVGAPTGRRPAPSVVRLQVTPDVLLRVGGDDRPAVIGRPDALSVAEATALARRLARHRAAEVTAAGDPAPSAPAGLPALPNPPPGARATAPPRARPAPPVRHP